MRLSLSIVIALVCLTTSSLASRHDDPEPSPRPSAGGIEHVSSSTAAALLARESAGPDTFDIYGGPLRVVRDPDGIPGNGDEYVEGKFEDPSGTVPRGFSLDPGDWTGVDLTENTIHGHVDDFQVQNLNGNGPANLAFWIGLPASNSQTAGWATAPGYGNDWRDELLFETPVADPTVGQTVGFDFVFNLDTEPAYDFVFVQFDSAGTWITVYQESGSSADPQTGVFEAPGWRLSERPGVRPIVYAGDDYGDDDHIRIRIRFESDGYYSDEDGNYPSDGAIQLDDVVITTSEGTFTEDFQDGTTGILRTVAQPFFGDFSDVYPAFSDIDPCHEDDSPMAGFVDYGQIVRNGPGADGSLTTGGQTSPTWNYGLPGGYVVNYTGGLSAPAFLEIANEIWSPPIEWDLPGGDDDAPEFVGAVLGFSVFRHNPLPNGIFYVWHVRSEVGGTWGPWLDRNYVYFSATAEWRRFAFDVTDLVPAGVERMQIALGVVSYASVFGFGGQDATPGPLFDDVRLSKVRMGGPLVRIEDGWLPQDAFPASGSITATTAADRDLLDVRFDMARDVGGNSTIGIVSGDSVVADVLPAIPGTSVASVSMHWALRQNPVFETDLRTLPSGFPFANVTSRTENGAVVWEGDVQAQPVTTELGAPLEGRWFVDLPDEDFLYPGDVLHFYWQAEDDAGRVATLPADTSGFADWLAAPANAYDRAFTMRALPTIRPLTSHTTGGDLEVPDSPGLLVVDEGGAAERDALISALGFLGFAEGENFDVYTVRDAASGLSNGLGAYADVTPLGDRRGPGARPEQLQYYNGILFLGDDAASLSNGPGYPGDDKSRDVEVLAGYEALPGQRAFVNFGGLVVPGLASSTVASIQFLVDNLSVQLLGDDLFDELGTIADLRAVGNPLFLFDPFDVAACPDPGRLAAIAPAGVAQVAWDFLSPGGGSTPSGFAAGVVHDRIVGGTPRVDFTLPFALSRVSGLVQRADLIDRIDRYAGIMRRTPDDAPPPPREPSLDVFPNPFNPTTRVAFVLPRAGVEATVVVYDLRGQRVRTLFDGAATQAELTLDWNGLDDGGGRIASGVYLVRAVTAGFRDTRKVALVK